MNKGRMEAFSDGVIAILITIMVLEFKAPEGSGVSALFPLVPAFVSYVLSFIMLGIYWSNHHHLLQATYQVDGKVLWANLHLLFWLSLIPFTTAWMGEHRFAAAPVALYGTVLLLAAIAYEILTYALLALHGRDSRLGIAIGRDVKGKLSIAAYAAAVPLSFEAPWLGYVLYVLVAIMWLVPDPRIEKTLKE